MSEAPVQPSTEAGVPQLTEAESSLIYEEMLRSVRIIQVASGGVRVFDSSGVFIRDEVLKAKLIFPRIDLTPGLERMLDRLMEKDEYQVSKVRNELYRSLYKPIKRSLDELVHDSRIFFADSSTLEQVRTDLSKVIERMDLLTLGMLNDILSQSELEFRRHIEAGVYSGLAGSVIFGDYKRKLTEKKVVEDLILMGIVHGLGPGLEKSKSFQELCRTSKSFYDVEKILEEVRTRPDKPTNVLNEILAVSLDYIKALDQDEDRDPLNALVALMASSSEWYAIGVGALAQKYAINEYMINYLVRDEAFHTKLRESEDRFARTIRERMERDVAPAMRKLGEIFLRQLRFKGTIRLGSDTMHYLDEFVGALLPVKSAASGFLERIAEIEHPDYVRLKALTENVIETIELCLEFHQQHTDPANWPELDGVPGAAYLIAYRKRPEIEYHAQHVVRAIERCHERAARLFASNEENVFRNAFGEFKQQMAAVSRFRAPMPHQPFDITRVLLSASWRFKQEHALRLAVGVPDEPVMVVVDPIGLEEVVQGLLEQIADGSGRSAGTSEESEGLSIPQRSLSIVASVSEHRCLVEIKDSSGWLPDDVPGMQEQFDVVSPGASCRVNVAEGSGTTVLLAFPLARPAEAAAW